MGQLSREGAVVCQQNLEVFGVRNQELAETGLVQEAAHILTPPYRVFLSVRKPALGMGLLPLKRLRTLLSIPRGRRQLGLNL